MKRFIFIVLSENVAAKYQSVHRLGIKNWDIKSVKFVFFNRDTSFFAAVKVLLLIVYIGYFRIDGNNGIGELEQAGQRIDETVFTDDYITAGTGFVPSVTITAQEDCSP